MRAFRTAPLRHAAKVLVSNVDKHSIDGQPWVRLVNYTDVYKNRTITHDMDLMVATAGPDQIQRFRVMPGDTIITKDSETPDDIGVPAHVQSADSDMVCGYHLAILRPARDLEPTYLYWAVASETTRRQLSVAAKGMTRFGLTYDAIQSAEIPVPERDEQRRIADFLGDQTARIDQIIAARQSQFDQLTEAVQSAAFSTVSGRDIPGDRAEGPVPWVHDLPTNWGSPRLNQVARMGTGHTPSRSVPEYWVGCDIPWLTTADVHKFRDDQLDVIVDTEIEISELGMANSAAVLHPRGTVALSRTASAGFPIVMGRDMATSQDYATWTCGPTLDNHFLLWCLRAMRRDLLGRLAMGSTHKTIYFPDLMSIRVPLPSIEHQRAAVRTIESLAADARRAKDAVQASVTLLQEFKRSLISAAVSGEFDVSTASGRGVPE